MENITNVSVFPSILGQYKTYQAFFDVMPPLWTWYAIGARPVDIT